MGKQWLIVLLIIIILTLVGCVPASAPAEELRTAIQESSPIPPLQPINTPVKVWQAGSGLAHHAILSNNGRSLAVGTSSGLYLYDAKIGRLIQELSPGEPVFTLAFSPDSRFLAYVPFNSNQVIILDTSDQSTANSYPAFQAPIRHLAFSPSSESLAVGTFNDIQLFSLAGSQLTDQITPTEGARIRDLSFSPVGLFITASLIREGPDQIAYWFTSDGSPSGTFEPAENIWLANAQISANSLWLAAEFGPHEGSVINPSGLLLRYLGPPMSSRKLEREIGLLPGAWTFSADSQWLTAGYRDGQIAIWSLLGDDQPFMLQTNAAGNLHSLELTPGGEAISVVYESGEVVQFTIPDGRILNESIIAYSRHSETKSTSQKDETLLSLEKNGRIQLWNTRTGSQQAIIEAHTDGPVTSLAFTPDGEALAVGMGNGRVKTLNTRSGQVTGSLPDHSGGVDGIAFSPDGRIFATGVGERVKALAFDDSVRLWSNPDGSLQQEMAGEQEEVAGCSAFQNQVAFTPDGKLLASASHDFTIQLWQTEDGSLQQVLTGHEAPVLDIAVAPDGKTIASASEDGTIRIWPITGGDPVQILPSPAFGFQSVAYAPDAKTLAGAGTAGDLILWNAETGEKRHQISAALNPRSDIIFSADGSLLAGAIGFDIHFWHPANGELAGVIDGGSGPITSLAFSIDGRFLAAGTQQGTVTNFRVGRN